MKINCKDFKLTENTGHPQFVTGLLLLLVIAYFSVFMHLDRLTLRSWDEASYLMNAKNMLERPNLFLVFDFKGDPDNFSPKPPLFVWFAALSLKLIPDNPELAIRMPAALFALFSIILLYAFGYYYLKNFAAGFLSAIVLTSAFGFFQWHIARTGDTDTTFVFWSLFCCLSFFVYSIEKGLMQNRALLLSGLGLLFAALTKGPAVIMLLPAFFLWLLFNKRLIQTLKSPHFWMVFGSVSVLVFLWYYIRAQMDLGFLHAVWEQELRARFEVLEPQVNQINPALYFLRRMIEKEFFMPWIILMIPTPLLLFRKEKTRETQLFKFILLVWLGCVFTISQSISIKESYDAIWYPLMALVTGVGILELIKKWKPIYVKIIFVCLVFLSARPLYLIAQKNIFERETQHLKPLLDLHRSGPYKAKKLVVYDQDFNPALFYYMYDDQRKGYQSEIWNGNLKDMPDSIDVITLNWKHEEELRNHFNTTKTHDMIETNLFHLAGRK